MSFIDVSRKAARLLPFDAIHRLSMRRIVTGSLFPNHYRSPHCLIMHEESLPQAKRYEMQFENGTAIGTSQLWQGGQYCSILTRRGIVGCGIYDLQTAAEFGQAIAIAKGTPQKPLVVPEDLLNARIVGVTPLAAELGIQVGCSGKEAVEKMLGG